MATSRIDNKTPFMATHPYDIVKDEMKARGCGIVCAMAWKNILGVTNIAKVLERLGLRETVAIQGYWNQMVDSPEGHECPICGAPCRCWGVFWYRNI